VEGPRDAAAGRSLGSGGARDERALLMQEPDRPRGVRHRLAWFVLLYVVSAAAFAIAVYGLRALIPR